ncbi:hypothetical protein Bbelb_196110 [Branchiostoma belcheri]|nr:hypothetical protein Bbelb_196110 [Branchiostoma belcheri]
MATALRCAFATYYVGPDLETKKNYREATIRKSFSSMHGRDSKDAMAENVRMEVWDTEETGNSDVKDGKTFKLQDRVEKKPEEPSLQQESEKCTGASAQAGLPSEGDELAELYESRKAAVPPPPVVRPKEPRPQPADALACRPPDPLYVRRAGLRFWCTKRILDWQRQALRAREDPGAVLKPVQEYGEEFSPKNAEIGEARVDGHDLAKCLPAEQTIAKGAAFISTNRALRRGKGDETGQLARLDFSTNTEFQTSHGKRKRTRGHRERYENHKDHTNHENDRKHAHYDNDEEHAHYVDEEQGHYENDEEHKYYQYDTNHASYENDKGHGHYENDGEQGFYEDDGEHKYYQYDKNHAHYENDKGHGHYENDGEQGHYENDGEQGHYENDGEQGHYENDGEQGHYENDGEHGHYENDEQHKYYRYDKNHARYGNDQEHRHYENDEEHDENDRDQGHYENDEEHTRALYGNDENSQDAIKNAAAQPFYEMDIILTNKEQEQPFYKMDVTAAKDKQQQEQPFYEMNVASADENSEQVFYRMDADQLAQPTPSENAYEDLDADFLAAQDTVVRRHGVGEPSRAESDDSRCSQNCSTFCRSHRGRIVALCVGFIIAAFGATVVAVILSQHRVLGTDPEENMVTLTQTTLPATSTTSSTLLPMIMTSQAATDETTVGTDWWGEWTLYVRAYFQQNSGTAAGLEKRYPHNEVVMVLLEDRFFWPFLCWYWKIYRDLPKTLNTAVGFGIKYGISSEYMESHGQPAYREFLSSMLNALEALRNKTGALPNNGEVNLALVRHALLDSDVEALANLFPYLEGTKSLFLINCRISADAATLLAGQLHLLHTLTVLDLKNNKIGDEGVGAIAETFPHLTELQLLNLQKTSVTNLGGRAIADRLVHLQQLQELFLQENELALSVSALAKAFANMTRLGYVSMWPVTCSSEFFRKAAGQVRDAVHTLAGQVTLRGGIRLYDGSSNTDGTHGLDTAYAWRRVEVESLSGSAESRRMAMWSHHLQEAPHKLTFTPKESLPPGAEEAWPTWACLNRLRTGTGRCRTLMQKWGLVPDGQTACDCGQEQTMRHLLVCPLLTEPCSKEDLEALTPSGRACAEYWRGRV